MAKWYGIVGIADDIETEPGFHEDSIVEKHYQGDVISTRWRRQTADPVSYTHLDVYKRQAQCLCAV